MISKAKQKALPGSWPGAKNEDPEVEVDEEEDEEADATEEVGDEFQALQVGILQCLVTAGSACSTGKLGFTLQARKKPVAAALYKLLEAGSVRRIDGIPPKWEAVNGVELPAISQTAMNEASKRFAWSQKASAGGPRPRKDDFDVLKRIVCQRLSQKGPNGMTAGALGYELGACRKAINAALYACEKEGQTWTVGEKGAGEKVRWASAENTESSEELPASFAYAAQENAAPRLMQAGPPSKRAKITHQVEISSVPASGTFAAPLSMGTPSGGNAISILNEWGQKNRRSVMFHDIGGQQSTGKPVFHCQVTIDGEAFEPVPASNKKEAKRLAAEAAIAQLGL